MNAYIISIGNELTSGWTVDTNGSWLAKEIEALGITVTQHMTVGDDQAAIGIALATAAADTDLVLVTGGLGPTPDDVTRFALADVLGTELVLHGPSLDRITAFFRDRKRPMSEANKVQAMIPRSATAIENVSGTAPGIHAHLTGADVYFLPGVPREMREMFHRSVRPNLAAASGGATVIQHELHTFGVSEAEIGEKLSDLMQRDRNPTVGTSAADLVISIRIRARSESAGEARNLINADTAECRRRLGHAVFGEEDETLAQAVARLLTAAGETISVAESCTGGLIAKRLTDVPGSSAYFIQGLVTYANAAKHRLLQIPMELIETHGAVSPEVARAMAENCRRIAATDHALAATGIAGPTGGTPEKPVGLVYISHAAAEGTTTKELHLGETLPRATLRDRTAKIALNLLRLALLRRVR